MFAYERIVAARRWQLYAMRSLLAAWLAIGPGIMALALATAGPPAQVLYPSGFKQPD